MDFIIRESENFFSDYEAEINLSLKSFISVVACLKVKLSQYEYISLLHHEKLILCSLNE